MNEQLANRKTIKTGLRLIGLGLAMVIGAFGAAFVLPALASAGYYPSAWTDWSKTKLVAENAILTGLPAGGLFPFLDSTPNRIVSGHIVLTDTTTECSPGAAPPSNLTVLVGEAGVALVPVTSAATNTGIGSPSQCVFHVTVRPGRGGVPNRITDFVVVNSGNAPLTGLQTVSASAEVDSNTRGHEISAFESQQD